MLKEPRPPEYRHTIVEEYLDQIHPNWRECITLLPLNTPEPSPYLRGFPSQGEFATLPTGTIGYESVFESMQSTEIGALGGLFITKVPMQGTVGPNRSINSKEFGHFYVIALPKEFEGGVPPQEDAGNLSTPEQVVSLMVSSKSEEEWDANCVKVKAAHNDYPSWWYKEIIMSGVAARTQAKWEK